MDEMDMEYGYGLREREREIEIEIEIERERVCRIPAVKCRTCKHNNMTWWVVSCPIIWVWQGLQL